MFINFSRNGLLVMQPSLREDRKTVRVCFKDGQRGVGDER